MVLLAGFTGVALLLSILASIATALPMHAFLYSAAWTLCLCISEVALGGTIRPSASTTIVLFAAWWAFLVGSIFPLIAGSIQTPGRSEAICRLPALAALYFFVTLQWSGVLYEFLHMETQGGSLSLSSIFGDLAALRFSGAANENPLPPFLGSFRWSHVIYVPLALFLRSNRFISRWHLVAICALALISAVVHFTRAPIVQLSLVTLVAWLTIYRPSRRSVRIASVAVGVALIVAFVAGQIAIDQQSSTKATLGQALSAYFGMPPLAYEDILKGQFPREPGLYSLDWFYFFATKMGAHIAYPSLTRPQIWFPIVTNVYTYLDVFTLDAGIPGAILGASLVGVLCSWAYRRNRRQSSLWTLSLYAYLCYCCLMTPINNEFIRANTLITLLLSWVATWLIRARPPEVPQGGVRAGARESPGISGAGRSL